VSSVFGALAGLLSWIIATRLVDPAEIGKASQFVSALLLVAGAVQLNLDVGLLRWLPGAGRHAGRLVWRTLLLVMLLAAVVGLVYALLLPSVARSAAGGASPWFGVALFVLAAAGWSVFTLHDSVLVALGRPWWTVWRNSAFATSRIGLLVALGGLGFGAQGIVLSWVGSIVLWIAAGTVVLAVLLQRSAVRSAEGSLPSRRRWSGSWARPPWRSWARSCCMTRFRYWWWCATVTPPAAGSSSCGRPSSSSTLQQPSS
jgi:O-antigen/teichoic acid export membrane protein